MPGGNDSHHRWIELLEGKQWSRLLYPNPVCFLSTAINDDKCDDQADDDLDGDDGLSSRDADGGSSGEATNTSETVAASASEAAPPPRSPQRLERNVMVLSWLTPTNNGGALLCSLHRRRYSTGRVMASRRFCLSVPTSDQIQLVLDVGSVSGSWGVSKFPADASNGDGEGDSASRSPARSGFAPLEPERPKRRRRGGGGPRFPLGIPGLQAVAPGTSDENLHSSNDHPPFFAIGGTVAHLQCRLSTTMSCAGDDDHVAMSAQVERAWVRSNYWDATKNLFRPLSPSASPYLTFLGSQTFGCVVPEERLRQLEAEAESSARLGDLIE